MIEKSMIEFIVSLAILVITAIPVLFPFVVAAATAMRKKANYFPDKFTYENEVKPKLVRAFGYRHQNR